MQEEVENRTVSLIISGSKFSGRLLKAGISKYLAHRKETKTQKSRDHPVEHGGRVSTPKFTFWKMKPHRGRIST